MAATVTFDNEQVGAGGMGAPVFSPSQRPMRVVTGQIDLDNSYPTGGEAVTSIADKFSEVLGVFIAPKAGYVFEYDYINEKVIAYWVDTTVDGAAMAQVANTTDLSAVTDIRFFAWGYSGIGRVS